MAKSAQPRRRQSWSGCGRCSQGAYKLTLLARHSTIAPEKNADVILTRDDPAAVVRSIRRLLEEDR